MEFYKLAAEVELEHLRLFDLQSQFRKTYDSGMKYIEDGLKKSSQVSFRNADARLK